ncbi:hypothetical protein ATE92_2224 [Ulvibacter sp. MAR_2010_11]|uniref:hypothetical protein n=1 Tax=Ulvibacter sp. MAR_2010_11 TaxID=1250229 RepID=UPI000C2CB1E2|nr:hypothetical protein [Ulvibacter sp. MAR_2010_11]PKA84054.1 hypothetical protein ATE92_2224 [Ulvibacter sp. MAR_2010_11]
MDTNPSGKQKALIAYLTFVGMLIAYFMNRDDKHEFAKWHIKNMFGLVILLFVSVALQNYEIGFYVYWISVGLWILSFVMALLNKQKAIPFLSEKFQTWFTFLD